MSLINSVQSFFAIAPTRSFGGFSGYVTISESTTDEIEITQQPVQQGASIADHAFKKPTNLSVQLLFGGTSSVTDLLGGTQSKSLPDIYQGLLNLQNTLTPFEISTPKRTYKNMMLAALGQSTDRKTENVLSITARFQQVIIVNVGTVQVPPAKQKTAKKTQATQKVGTKSALLSGVQGVNPSVAGYAR